MRKRQHQANVDLLKGIRILSFNHFMMGPVGVQFLADLGDDAG
jgi:crotonobetainyl-CoA:carnitine CoA-transferase CaiB-like acyl-CoA transferase